MNNFAKGLNFTGLSKLFAPTLVLTILCSIAMITLGGIVKNTGSSLACPDWPTCHGSLMPEMTGGVAIEHSHRILGTIIGLLVIALVFMSWAQKEIRKRSLIALFLVVLQGVLGGVTVLLEISPLVSTLHLALSQIFIAYLLILWVDIQSTKEYSLEPTSFLKMKNKISLVKIAVGALFFQIVFGASLRHGGAGFACGVGAEASLLCRDMNTGAILFFPESLAAKVNLFHRFFAFVVTGLVIASTVPVIKFARASKLTHLRILSVSAHILVCTQVGLGIATVWTGLSLVPLTAHLLVAALLWLVMLTILRQTQNLIDGPGAFTIAKTETRLG